MGVKLSKACVMFHAGGLRVSGESGNTTAMRKLLPVLGLLSVVALSPTACGAPGSQGSVGDDGGGSSGGGSGSSSGSGSGSGSGGGSHVETIFLILMENHNWSDIMGSSSAPNINALLTDPQASWCTNYHDNPANQHPSEPNYIWLEAGTNALSDHTFSTDSDPSKANSSAAPHLGSQLAAKGVSFKDYAEDIDGTTCPIVSSGNYAAKHVPFVFFQDIVGNPPSATNTTCMQHVVPYTQLATDLTAGTVAKYNFISPNLCDDMHNACAGTEIGNGDTWLKPQIDMIRASSAYKNNGAIFITWDESEAPTVGGPIGMIVLSPLAKGKGYQSAVKYYHSSMVRTVEDVFGLTPLLNDAANQPNLSDLFTSL